MLFVLLFKLTAYLPLMLYFHPRITGKKQVPREPCILAMNHGHAMDPCMINLAFPLKRIYMLTSKHLFNCSRLHQWELRQMGCRPCLSPAGDIETMTEIAGGIRPCEHIGYFAEGKIQAGIGNFRSGPVMLALQTDLPLVPVYIKTAPFYKGGSHIVFGKPVDLHAGGKAINSDRILQLNEELRRTVIMLSDDQNEGRQEA